METSLRTGFAQIFSRCPKNLSCPKFGGAAAPLAPPARTPMSLKIFFIYNRQKGNPNATGTFSLRARDVLRSSPVCPDFAPISCNIISPFNIPLALPPSVYKNVNYWANETNLNV